MKFYTVSYVIDYPWEDVTAAFFKKYPNPLQPHVTSVHTLNFQNNIEKNEIRLKKLLFLTYNIPKWVLNAFGSDPDGMALEETLCELDTKTLTLQSENLTLSKYISLKETCIYTPHPACSKKTVYTQKASYEIKGFGMLAGKMESVAVKSAIEKSKIGVDVVESIIEKQKLMEETQTKSLILDSKSHLFYNMAKTRQTDIQQTNELTHHNENDPHFSLESMTPKQHSFFADNFTFHSHS